MPTIKFELKKSIDLQFSKHIDFPIMVSSHERSGTHFLMNCISSVSHYTQKPFFNFDYQPCGSFVNFFSITSTSNFLEKISKYHKDGENYHLSSIVKSHFPLSLMSEISGANMKHVYIYRNPVDTLISYWKFVQRWSWFEGPKVDCPLKFITHSPSGQSRRYQVCDVGDYFDRWAAHVTEAFELSKDSRKIYLLNYADLVEEPKICLKGLLEYFDISQSSSFTQPDRGSYIRGSDIDVSDAKLRMVRSYCKERLGDYQNLPDDILSQCF